MNNIFSRLATLISISGILVTSLFTVSDIVLINTVKADNNSPSISLSPVVKETQGVNSPYVFDVVIHKPAEMNILLDRIEQLSSSLPPGKDDPSLALVLHGPEIAFFTKMNYPKYMNLVDRAAALDKKGIIDVKVCDTMIRELQLQDAVLPEFVEHVPYGPAEVDRLVQKGFIKM